ncbi:MAG TPA: RcnB family protein [Allosphingosinicella sp.]|jgi:Ni/Co efflux regulator RcnB|nr:RcnB family protein [Allosphingosinicella sp.]
MKKLILGVAAAASVLAAAAPASAQTFGRHDDRGRVEQVQRNGFANRDFGRRDVQARQVQVRQAQTRNWRQGDRFDSRYAGNYRIIGNPYAYRLREAPRGYRWVQSGNDAVLVALASGLIGAIVGNAF